MIPYVRLRVPPPLISLLLSLDKGYSRHLVKAKSICVTMRTQTNVYKKVQYGAILCNKVFFTAMPRNWCINAPVSYFPESWVILISQGIIQDTGYISIVIDNLTNAYYNYKAMVLLNISTFNFTVLPNVILSSIYQITINLLISPYFWW